MVSGVPLFALKDIPDYESAYKTKVDLKEAGIHIFESSKMDWRKELGLLYNDKKGIKTFLSFFYWLNSKNRRKSFKNLQKRPKKCALCIKK